MSNTRQHRNKSDYGVPDYYKFYTKKYKKISKTKYNSIITDFNTAVYNLIIEDNLVYQLPFLGFEILIKKDKRKPKIKDGKLINNVPVDWKATNELWEKDEEAKKKKLLVRYNNSHTSNYVFRIYFKKFKSSLKNRSLYKFKPIRQFQRALAKRINDPDKDNYDAYLLYNKK